jgi:hypothetical protein
MTERAVQIEEKLITGKFVGLLSGHSRPSHETPLVHGI